MVPRLRLFRLTRLDREEGQVLPMFAAAVGALLLMAGVVVDGGNLFQHKQSVQNAADATAIAAAFEVANGNCTDPATDPLGPGTDACATYAGIYAGLNGANGAAGDSSDSTALSQCARPVSDTTPPNNTPCYVYPYHDDAHVEVWLTRTTANFFGRLLHFETSAVSARAVAAVIPKTPSGGPGIYIYSSGDVTLTGSSHIQEPIVAQGNLVINGGSASVDAIARLVAIGLSGTGTVIESGGGTLGDGSLTSLTATLTAATTSAMTVGSAQNFQNPGTVFLTHNPLSCNPNNTCPGDEWIAYLNLGGAQLKNLTRGYGGYNALPASQHLSGDSVDPRVTDFYAPGGCGAFCASTWFHVNHVHNSNTDPYTFTPPTFDVNTAFANAELGPSKTCGLGSVAAGFFGTGSVPSDATTTTDLTPNTGYICKRLDAYNNVIGEISWGGTSGFTSSAGTVPAGELRLKGTVFINANLKLSNAAIYQVASAGAVIWSTGGLALSKTLLANCGTAGSPAACGFANWNPNLGLLGIVAHEVDSNSQNCIVLSGGAAFQGAMYADGGTNCVGKAIDLTGSGIFQGIADGASVKVEGTPVEPTPTIADLPADFPGGGSTVTLVG